MPSEALRPPDGILVTGGTGFIGRHLCRRLTENGYSVRVLSRRSAAMGRGDAGVEIVPGDVGDRESVLRAMEGAQGVFHLASLLGAAPVDRGRFLEVNARGTENVLSAARRAGVRRFVHVSSVGVLGSIQGPPAGEDAPYHPEDIYELSKQQGEEIARRFAAEGDPVVIVRPTWVYGPGDRRTLKLMRAIQKRYFFFVGDGRTLEHPIFVEDLVEGMGRCLTAGLKAGEILTLGGAQIVPIRELCEVIADSLGVRLRRVHVPRQPLRFAAGLLEDAFRFFKSEAPLTRAKVDFFFKPRAYDVSKAARLIGFTARVPLEEGIPRTVAWYRAAGDLA